MARDYENSLNSRQEKKRETFVVVPKTNNTIYEVPINIFKLLRMMVLHIDTGQSLQMQIREIPGARISETHTRYSQNVVARVTSKNAIILAMENKKQILH